MTIDEELRVAADELLDVIERSPVPPVPDPQTADDLLVDYLETRRDDGGALSARSRWSGVGVAVAAAILIVVGVVVVADGGDGEIVTDPVSAPDAIEPVASPTATVAPYTAEDVVSLGGVRDERFPELDLQEDNPSTCDGAAAGEVRELERLPAWSRVCDAATFDRAEMNAVVAAGPGLVAVGGEDDWESAPPNADAAVWTSVEGLTWSRLPHDEEVFGGDGVQQMFGLTIGGPGLVAVGRDGPDEQGDAAVWTSVDGLTWSRVPHDEEVFGGPGEQRMDAVTVGGPGLVAVGSEVPPGPEQADAAVWTSVDGLTWSRLPHDEEVFGGLNGQRMLSVTAGGPGLVAVGGDGPPGIDQADAAVWTSVDGMTWSRVPHDEEVFGGSGWQQMDGVTIGGPGLMAVGRDRQMGEGHAAVWSSVDGLTWSRVPYVGAGPMLAVTAVGPGLVAVGGTGFAQGWNESVWASPDGLTWSQLVGGENYGQMLSVTVGGPGLVAVGSYWSEEIDGWRAAVWVTS